jgi:hypothetical protein
MRNRPKRAGNPTLAPFHACDYLCERCPETDSCGVYALLEDKALSRVPDDGACSSTQGYLDDVKESLDETIELLRKIAGDLGIELVDVPDEMEDFDRCSVEKDELCQLASTFAAKAHVFLKRVDPFIKLKGREAFEDMAWYHTMVAVKTRRAVDSDYSGYSEDATLSAGVAVKSLTKCIEALGHLGEIHPPALDEARALSKSALVIRLQIKKRFSLSSASTS